MNILGTIKQNPISIILDTGYDNFESPSGIDGMAKASDGRLDILAVVSRAPGSFRNFIQHAKLEFDCIYIWEVWNPELAEILDRYGFKQVQEFDAKTNEELSGYKWNRS